MNPKRTVTIAVEIPARGPEWNSNSHYTLTLRSDGAIAVKAPCGQDYGHILMKDLQDAARALELTPEEKKLLGSQ